MTSQPPYYDGHRPITIGVAGGSGSGKTTVSKRLLERIGEQNITYVPHDAYYRNFQQIPRIAGEIVNFDHPDALETTLLIEHLKLLQAGERVEIPIYDFSTHSRLQATHTVYPSPIILVEGILIFVDTALRDLFDIRIYVDTDADIRFIRRLKRDVAERGRTIESVIYQYLESVRPMHLEFVESSKRYADVIVPEGGYNDVAIRLITDHVQHIMAQHRAPTSSD
ncbi:MAG: uridine kinase [Anaerolineae bacterium]